MDNGRWIMAAVALVAVLLAVGCGHQPGKAELMAYYQKQIEWMQSPEYRELMEHNPDRLMSRGAEMLGESGLTLEQSMDLAEKLADDPEVKALVDQIRRITEDLVNPQPEPDYDPAGDEE